MAIHGESTDGWLPNRCSSLSFRDATCATVVQAIERQRPWADGPNQSSPSSLGCLLSTLGPAPEDQPFGGGPSREFNNIIGVLGHPNRNLGVCIQHVSLVTLTPRVRLSIAHFSMRARSRHGGCRPV